MSENNSYSWDVENVVETGRLKENDKLLVEDIQSGDFVKLIFQSSDEDLPPERMWVKVTNVLNGALTGELDNDPVNIKGLMAGDEIKFASDNILEKGDF